MLRTLGEELSAEAQRGRSSTHFLHVQLRRSTSLPELLGTQRQPYSAPRPTATSPSVAAAAASPRPVDGNRLPFADGPRTRSRLFDDSDTDGGGVRRPTAACGPLGEVRRHWLG